MKTSSMVIVGLVLTFGGLQAQVVNTNTGAKPLASPAATLPAPTPYQIVGQDDHSRLWERTVYEPDAKGNVVARKHRFTELGTGLNFKRNNQWLRSREEIDLLPAGGAFAAAATNGQHQAWFPADICQGAVQLLTPDGKQMVSRPVGLFYADDQNTALIALLTNSVGELVGSNRVVYPDAFEGAAASIRYTYTKAGFEQDVIVQGQLPDPAALGLSPARTRLGVLTVFFDTNNPVATAGPVDAADGLSDTTLRFGAMKMGRGRAFSIGNTEPSLPPVGGTPAARLNWFTNAVHHSAFSTNGAATFKRWFQMDGRNYLMEEVPYRRVAPQLEQLPPATGRLNDGGTNLLAGNSWLDAIPARLLSAPAPGTPAKTQAMRLSRVDWDQTRALVLDYVTVNTGGNYTFQGDTTYYVSGPCDFNNVTLEGGTVIKYPSSYGDWDSPTAPIEVDGTVTCNTSSYRPAVFTAVDDNTVGEEMGNGQPGGNSYASPAIYAPGGVTLHNVRFCYAAEAVWVGDGSSVSLSDVQMIGGNVMVVLGMGDGYGTGMTATLNNCLYGDMDYGIVILDLGLGGDSYYLNNCTFDSVYQMVYGEGGYYYSNYGTAVNCVFANTGGGGYASWQGNYNGFYNSDSFCNSFYGSVYYSSTDYPFQTVGAADYYLAGGSFQGGGTTGIGSGLRADLAGKTTYPPIVYSDQTFSAATNFSPQAPRDNSGTAVDLGYHYDPMDYCFGGVTAQSNVTFTAGTAVGWFELPGSGGPGYGLALNNDIFAAFNGTATSSCVFVRYDTVQEGGNGNWTDLGWLGGMENGDSYDQNNPAGVTATFTHFSHLAGDPSHFRDGTSGQPIIIQAQDCEFYGGAAGGNILGGYTNCLFYRAGFGIGTAAAYPYQRYLNCTFYGGSLGFGHSEGGAPYWYSFIHDCAFDNTTFSVGDPFGSNTNYGDYNYNAFLTNADRSVIGGSHDVTNLLSFNWQGSWFGNFYLPGNSPLINAGDRTADQIRLRDFTTQTSQVPESYSIVDIGYHYMAASCVENGPHTNVVNYLQGTFVPGALTPTNITTAVGQVVLPPTASGYGYSITNWMKVCFVSNDCPATGPNYYFTNNIPYAFGSVYYVPAMPSVFWTSGIYTYTAQVIATGSPCNPLTNTLGTVTVYVGTNTPDVLLDVDFGKSTNSLKTGYAAIGDGTGDFWNSYAATGHVSGVLANLKTADGIISPVGLLVTNLPKFGTNGSSDPMYAAYLSTNAGTATMTLTNLPSGTWNVFLYANDGNFDLQVGTNDLGTQTTYDASPSSTPMAWHQGVQYVVFQNVVVTNGQRLTVTIYPGTNGAAMISGLQIASATHVPPPLPSAPAGIVSWWRAETNALDSIGTNNGTLQGGTGYAAGEVGQAFNLNGTNAYVAVPSSPNLKFTNVFSAEGWINLNKINAAGGGSETIVTKGQDAEAAMDWMLTINNNGKLSPAATVSGAWNGGSCATTLATGAWYHVAMTYDGSSLRGYVNGRLDGTFTMSGLVQTTDYPLRIGAYAPVNGTASKAFFPGRIDELSLYNHALSSNEIASIYNDGSLGKAPSLTQDSDYDGVSDVQELAYRTNPNDPNSAPQIRLGYWSFDYTNWAGSAGQLPLQSTNLVGVSSWATNAVLIDSTNIAILKYRDVETNGNANINLRSGTVRFWFKPDWSSTNAGGSGPGSCARVIEMGTNNPSLTTNSWIVTSVNGWWSLFFSADGSQLAFGSSTNGLSRVNLSANISWTSNVWHQVVLTYGATNSVLYLDGQPDTNGLGSLYFPNTTERAAGFRLGCDQNGGHQARGVFDELETFNYPLDAGSISANYQAKTSLDSDGDGISNILENQLGLNPYGYNSPNGLTSGISLMVFTPLK